MVGLFARVAAAAAACLVLSGTGVRAQDVGSAPTPAGAPPLASATTGDPAIPVDRRRLKARDRQIDDLLDRATMLSATQNYDGATALLDTAIAMDPDNVKARLARGGLRRLRGDWAGTREDYDHAVEVEPTNIEALLSQGVAALAEGRNSDAVVSYDTVLRLVPAMGSAAGIALRGRAQAYYGAERWDLALADFRAVMTATHDFTFGRAGELSSLIRLGRMDEARTLIDDKLRTEPNDTIALRANARLAILEGRPADALPALDASVDGPPPNPEFMGMRAELRARSGDVEGARADFATYRALAHGDAERLNNACWHEAVIGFDLETALADCDAASALAASADFVDSRGLVLLQMGRFDEAKAAYDTVLADHPDFAASLYGRGLARLMLGDEAGREDIERGKAIKPDVLYYFGDFQARHPELSLR